MITPRFHSEAREELRQAAVWYERRRRGLGRQFTDEVERAVQDIVEAPERWPRWSATLPERKVIVKRFPYIVVYEHVEGEVFIKAVAHGRRKPGYWTDRSL